MADQEKVTRLKSISDVDAWVTQFTIDLEDRKPELAKMLTKRGWETLPDATKEPSKYTPEEIKAVEFNKVFGCLSLNLLNKQQKVSDVDACKINKCRQVMLILPVFLFFVYSGEGDKNDQFLCNAL